ncbi:hypothetical protein PLICRDRAFT_627616 [Plicaturopsis crispa FD-325 SS-3]|nr:hypothetical protein PLICRDRAFT_627616 [Plicaturopsis crispa FD-325 SS-3]
MFQRRGGQIVVAQFLLRACLEEIRCDSKCSKGDGCRTWRSSRPLVSDPFQVGVSEPDCIVSPGPARMSEKSWALWLFQ